MGQEEEISIENIEYLIEKYMAFLIKTVSSFTGRYISIENDEEFEIALLAFTEAVEKYQSEKGVFLAFAKLVIVSRLKNYAEKEKKHEKVVSLDELYESGQDFQAEEAEEQDDYLQQEILRYKKELLFFGLTFEKLADEAPRHKDTRETALDAAEKAGKDEEIVEETYRKRKLPIRRVAVLAELTEKVIKRSKSFILSAMIIFAKEFPSLLYWIRGTRCKNVS
ncbi:MAG: sigma factor [Bacillota bacterium]|nr:sigma factor [Bacillota bacterium]MEE0469173.1 sigma factor [Blautia sp.]